MSGATAAIKGSIDAVIDLVKGSAASLPEQIKGHYIQNGRTWQEANIIGVRFAKDFYTNKFLDVLAIVTDSDVLALRATTVPGPYWTPGPFWTEATCKRLGVTYPATEQAIAKRFGISYAAILCLGYYENAFGFANHRDHPPGQALRGKIKLPAFRDINRDSKMQSSEGPFFEAPNSGVDIHAQSLNDTDEAVNFASAECQVAQSRALFLSRFMPMLYATKEAKKGAAARFSYLLTDDSFPFAKELKAKAV